MSIFGKVLVMLNSILLACAAPCLGAAEEGAKIFAESCSPCHSAKIRPLDNTHLTKEQWKEAIDRMIDQGVPRGKRHQ